MRVHFRHTAASLAAFAVLAAMPATVAAQQPKVLEDPEYSGQCLTSFAVHVVTYTLANGAPPKITGPFFPWCRVIYPDPKLPPPLAF